jgi:hypothetical protein
MNKVYIEAARDALRKTGRCEQPNCCKWRGKSLTADLTKWAAQFDAQERFLMSYRMTPDLAGAAG